MAVTTNFQEAVVDLVTDITSAENVTLSNAMYTKFFEVSKFADAHTVIPGVREGKLIPIISTNPNYAKFPHKDPTNCDIPACDIDLPFAAKGWEIGMIACKTPICINTFDENFLVFWGQYKRLFGDADMNSALMQFIMQTFERDGEAALWREAYFGDRSTPSGDPNYQLLRSINGIFTQAEAGDGYKIEIPENLTTTALTGEQVYNLLKEAYLYASVQPWFDPATLQFEMTSAMGAILIGWYNSLNERSPYNCECYLADGVTGTPNFTLDGVNKVLGIPIVIRREFDGIINQLDLGYRYRALLTSRDNILFGTTELDQLPTFKMWYSEDDDMIYIKGGAQVAASLVTDDYVYIGAEVGTNSES